MDAPTDRPRVTAPIGPASVLVRVPTVDVAFIHDQCVLVDRRTTAACLLDGPATRLWLDLVGTPLGTVLDALVTDHPELLRRDVLETVRVLRVLGMVEDGDRGEDVAPPMCALPRATTLTVSASVIVTDTTTTLVYESDGATRHVNDPSTTVPSPIAGRVHVVAVDPSAGPDRALGPLEVLGVLAATAPTARIEDLAAIAAYAHGTLTADAAPFTGR